ncbi:MAG: ATP-binding protein [Patescibacteria group bacterium]
MQKYIKRGLEPILAKASKTFPAIIVTGPRQSGKTTLVKNLFGKNHAYVSFDDPDIRLLAAKEPQLFLKNYPPPLIIDEVQYVPEIFSYLKMIIDQNRQLPGQIILTGSQLFPLMADVAESLAGRIAVFNLLPLSLTERFPQPINLTQLKQAVFLGGFPELSVNRKINSLLWFSSYIQTYLERDIRQLKQVANLTDFQRFLQLAAANNGQIVNLSGLANDLGVAVNTVKSWLSLLEASGQISLIKSYYRNRGKRLIKSPKLYFLDTGLFCHLVGLTNPDQIFIGPFSGCHLETLVLSEIYKHFYNQGLTPKVYFWRTSAQQEVDFIVEDRGQIIPLEIKLTAKANLNMTKSLTNFMELFKLPKGFIVNLGDKTTFLSNQVTSLPISNLLKIFN